MKRQSRIVPALTWIIPAAVLTIAGVAKLLDPSGVQPLVLTEVVPQSAWPAWLRGLGLLEVLLAALLMLPRTRGPARLAAFTLLALFSGFTALNAADTRFIENCGCMGDLRVRPEGAMGPLYWTVLRNAALGGLLMLGHMWDGAKKRTLPEALEQVALVVTVLALAPLYAGERVQRRDVDARIQAVQSANARLTMTSWQLPDLPLLDPSGTPTTSDAQLQGGDVLVFFRTDCSVCVRRAPAWARLAETLAGRGQRLLLVALDERDPIAAFKVEHGLSALEHVVMRSRRDATRIGVFGVPNMMALDEQKRVAFSEAEATAPSFAESLSLVASRSEGLDEEVWSRVTHMLFGDGFVLESFPSEGVGEVSLPVHGPDGELHRLHLLRAPANNGGYVELAAGVDGAGVLTGVVPLMAGRYLRFLDPDLRAADELRGHAVKEALELARTRAKGETPARPVWLSLSYALGVLEHRLETQATSGK